MNVGVKLYCKKYHKNAFAFFSAKRQITLLLFLFENNVRTRPRRAKLTKMYFLDKDHKSLCKSIDSMMKNVEKFATNQRSKMTKILMISHRVIFV